MSEVMITKLLPPRMSGELIERPRLMDCFIRNREYRLIVVTAPAGYGKTVSILQYVNTLGDPVIWYQLDSYDNDPVVFIKYLITGLQKHFPGVGKRLLSMKPENENVLPWRFMVVALLNELAGLDVRNLVLVLDDYHHIAAPVIHQFMEEFIQHLPTGIRIIIASRTALPLPLTRWQVKDELKMIESNILCFTPGEVHEFLAKRRVAHTGEQINLLIDKTGGWPAALKLLAGNAVAESASSTPEIKYIYDYLANEVFDRQPEEYRRFLLSTSVLETMTPEMCDLLLEWNDSMETLDALEKQQLFLTPLAGSKKAYRYHQLFRDFLLQKLGNNRTKLWYKAGEIFLNKGNLDQAMENFLLAGEYPDGFALFQKAGQEALRQGRWQTLERWLGMLSMDNIVTDPWLCFFQAQIKTYRGQHDQAENWINNALALFRTVQAEIGIAECHFLQARILNGHGRHQESLRLLEKAYPVLNQTTSCLRFDLPLEMAITLFRNGRFQEAVELLNQSLQIAEKHHEYQMMAHLLEGLGHTYYWMGEHAKALQCYQRGIRVSPNRILPSYNFQDLVASIYQEWGELDEALEYAERSVAYKEKLGMIEALPSAYYQLGNIYIDFGELKKAEACYRQGIALAEDGGARHFLSLNKAYLVRCLGFQGRSAESLELAEEVLNAAQNQSDTLLASCRVICAPAFIQNGDIPRARNLLLQALPPLEHWNFTVPLSYCYGTLAILNFKIGNLQQADELSRKLLKLAARQNLIRLFLTIAEYHSILRYGLEHDIEVSFIQRVLVRMGERSTVVLNEVTRHPAQEVRIRAILPLLQINTPVSRGMLESLKNDSIIEVRQTVKQYENLSDVFKFSKSSELKNSRLVPNHFRKQEVEHSPHPGPFLEIRMLGPARVILNNVDITTDNWRHHKSRDLLLYLCHQGHPVPIHQVLEDLWPGLPSEKSIKSFYSVLYWLRQAIQKDLSLELVTFAAKMCVLQPLSYTTDKDRFVSLINTGTDNYDGGMTSLEEAVGRYQGEYLSGLDYAWVIPEREHLKRLYLEAAIRLVKFYHRNHQYLKAVGILVPLAEENPLREEIFGLLMSSHAYLGDRKAVIRQYQKLKSNLFEELGLEPAPETKKLYYQLCSSEI